MNLYCNECNHELHIKESRENNNSTFFKTRCLNDDCYIIGSTFRMEGVTKHAAKLHLQT